MKFSDGALGGLAIGAPDIIIAVSSLGAATPDGRALAIGLSLLHGLVTMGALLIMLDRDSFLGATLLAVIEGLKALGFSLQAAGHGLWGVSLVLAAILIQCRALERLAPYGLPVGS